MILVDKLVSYGSYNLEDPTEGIETRAARREYPVGLGYNLEDPTEGIETAKRKAAAAA